MKSPIQDYLAGLHRKYAGVREGAVASYIPELAKANPDWFAICIATTDGRVYEVGDSRQPFTIQSISKPLTYGLALEDRGLDGVLRKIGVEPTGDAFNSISLAPGSGRPLNPMINAGAIAAASLVDGHSQEDRRNRLLAVYSLYAGRPLDIDQTVFESERSSGHRNRAIGHMLRNFDILDDPEPALDLYFRQCSVAVDCRDLSMMAATLANGGVNPATGERAVPAKYVDRILSVMTTCGLYDYAGEWVYRVGMPAKSGVGGGMLIVLPGQLGIGVFSPPLDERGNSVRAVQVCQELSQDLDLHFLRVPRSSRSAVRAQYSLADVRSRRRRPESERNILRQSGGRARVYELQGDLLFPSIEAVVRAITDRGAELGYAVLDFKRVTQVAGPSGRMLFDLIQLMNERGQKLVLCSMQDHSKLLRFLAEQMQQAPAPLRLNNFPDVDAAMEWCETHLIADLRGGPPAAVWVQLAEHDLCRHLDAEAVAQLETSLEHRRYGAGAYIVSQGDRAEEMYLLMSGQVSVTLAAGVGPPRRLSTLSAGMSFGDLAVMDGGTRSADVRADTIVECKVLTSTALERLGVSHPQIKIALLKNMLRSAHQIISRLNQEVAALSS